MKTLLYGAAIVGGVVVAFAVVQALDRRPPRIGGATRTPDGGTWTAPQNTPGTFNPADAGPVNTSQPWIIN